MIIVRPWMFAILVILIMTYEVLAVIQKQGFTISEIIWFLSKDHPILAVAFGIVIGHFFWQAVPGHPSCINGGVK